MYHKCISYRRQQRARMIRHREYIIDCIYCLPIGEFIITRGKLAKGKVHCSCPLCAAKSKHDRGIRSRSIHTYKISDQRKFNKIAAQLDDICELVDLQHIEGDTISG